MNCDHFQQRMQRRLDRRLNLSADPELARHAKSCGPCQDKMNTWQSIAFVIEGVDRFGAADCESVARRSMYPSLVVAALLLIAVGFAGSKLLTATDQVVLTESTNASSTGDVHTSLDALEWWASVRDRDWLAQAMPAVRSVQQGVAPLGRSLLQAVTVLTVGDPGQAS